MLDDVEQRRLSEIDAFLTASDPALARTLSRRSAWKLPLRATVSLSAFALVVAVLVGALIAGPPAAIVGGLLVAAVVVGCWLQIRQNRPESSEDA
jgi:hypothetical protein